MRKAEAIHTRLYKMTLKAECKGHGSQDQSGGVPAVDQQLRLRLGLASGSDRTGIGIKEAILVHCLG